jgi:hypothetical protein
VRAALLALAGTAALAACGGTRFSPATFAACGELVQAHLDDRRDLEAESTVEAVRASCIVSVSNDVIKVEPQRASAPALEGELVPEGEAAVEVLAE